MTLIVKLAVAIEDLPSPMPSFDPFSKDSSLSLSSWVCPLKVITVSYRAREKELWFHSNLFSNILLQYSFLDNYSHAVSYVTCLQQTARMSVDVLKIDDKIKSIGP